MLNCTNSLEPQSMNSGIEHAALMVSEEKTQHDSPASERCLEGGRNTLQGRSGASAPHHHRQQIPVCPNSGP
ncbi:unnamed protein product [Ceratitis capitata]|nr:unnamed protein product [Ceratitis capitata]